jgi:hydroxymethylpyrimidine/phosphomethylpyrimidine kinase
VTAITVQDTAGVEEVMPLDPEWVADQARAVLEDMPVQAFKIGLLGSVEIIATIAEVISDYPQIPLVMDPVSDFRPRRRTGKRRHGRCHARVVTCRRSRF